MKWELQFRVNVSTIIFLYFIFVMLWSYRGRRVVRIFVSLIKSETLMELMFNPCGEFWWNLEVPVSQICSPHLHVRALGGLFRSFKVCSDAKERAGCGRQREATVPIQSLVKLLLWFLSLRWKTCLWQNWSQAPALAVKDLPLGRTLWWWSSYKFSE